MKTIRKINTKRFLQLFVLLLIVVMANSCTDELDKKPLNTRTPEKEYTSVNGYKTGLVSVFSNLAYTPFLRFYWGMQEYTTDEAVNSWNDDGRVWAYHDLNWSADLSAISTVYKAALDIITEANFFISESTPQKIASRGFSPADSAKITQFQAEARFLRAFSFWVLMDAFGNPPFPTVEDLGTNAPKQIQRADLFKFIENELKEIEPILADPKTNERGRPCRAAAWALLSRMYLNGKIYTGQDYYTEAITYCDKIISSGYALENRYDWLMLGDNHLNTNEFIFTINYDNTNYTFNSTNFLILGPANVPATVNGLSSSWRSFRVTQQFVSIFGSDISIDKRAMFYTTGQNRVVTSIPTSTDGYSAFKYRNFDRSGSSIKQTSTRTVQLSDVDFPLFRLAEIYLIYAEAVLRGGEGGSTTKALEYINKLRGRAYASDPSSTSGNISSDKLTLDFILDERARELYWEAHRRTDLIRYNKLTTADYLWAWKGGVIGGTGVDSKYNLFPIPTADLLANPNLKQLYGF